MEPFFFGMPAREMLGIYHPAAGVPRAEGVVLCPPLFGEYMRSHACLRRLALTLAGNGRHVLRFDYFGTGDSGGRFRDTTPEDWARDVAAAVEELKAVAGVRRVRLVGARLGATLAARAAMGDDSIDRVVLWDPIVDGADYLRQLRATHESLLEAHGPYLERERAQHTDQGLSGFRVSDEMLEQLGRLTLPSWADILARPGLSAAVVLSEEDFGYAAMAEDARRHDVPVERVGFDCDWTTFRETVLFPHAIEKAIVDKV